MTRLLLASCLSLTALGVLAAQDQQPAFRAGTSLVPIYVTVTDQAGRLVSDLTADDFEVKDNGRLRPLAFFTSDIQPFSVVVMLDRRSMRRMVERCALKPSALDELRRLYAVVGNDGGLRTVGHRTRRLRRH